MEVIPHNDVLEFHCDTLQFLRNQYNLNDRARINESIDILEEWLKKQQHFAVKEFSREYLERAIILAKGSVEKVKKKLDSLFTYKTLLPKYFQLFDADIRRSDKTIIDTFLPKLTPDHYRVFYLKMKEENPENLINYYRWSIAMFEYIHAYDYCNGILFIFDYTDIDPLELLKRLDIIDVNHILRILAKGYGLRVAGIHLITPSKLVNVALTFFKQAAGAKIGKRIFAHKNFDTLYDVVSKDILPSDCGGTAKPLDVLHDNFLRSLSSTRYLEYLLKMQKACTIEELRQTDKFNYDYMGTPGSFRSLCLD